jgi:AraC-like DNA-binding protein
MYNEDERNGGNVLSKNNICLFSQVLSSDLICTNFVYEKTDIQAQKSRAETYLLGFVTEGKGTLTQDGVGYPITCGDAFFIQRGCPFSIEREGVLRYYYISFYGRRADELVLRFGLSPDACVFSLADRYDALTEFAFDCLKKANSQNTDLLGECCLLYLLSHLDTQASTVRDLLNNIVTVTNTNFTDPHFSLRELAGQLNYDAKYLSFYFKKNKGIRYSEYLREKRIRHAAFFMEQGITSVNNVALLSGFTDVSYFSKGFKKEMGCTPKEYIARLAREKKTDSN